MSEEKHSRKRTHSDRQVHGADGDAVCVKKRRHRGHALQDGLQVVDARSLLRKLLCRRTAGFLVSSHVVMQFLVQLAAQ